MLARRILGLFCLCVSATCLVNIRFVLRYSSPDQGRWVTLLPVAVIFIGWAWGILRDPIAGFLTPVLFLLHLARWQAFVMFVANAVGQTAILAAATLLVRPRFWDSLGWQPEERTLEKFVNTAEKVPTLVHWLPTLVTELSFVPALCFLFCIEKLLVDVSQSTWHWPRSGSTEDGFRRDKPIIVLLHGSGMNSCQWVVARHFLHLYGLGRVYSVNYLSGFWKRGHQGKAVPEFASTVAEQVVKTLSLDRCEAKDTAIVLVGHSLGGVVASYIHEHNLLAPLNIKLVIPVSAPLQGSDLLCWAREHIPTVLRGVRVPGAIDLWMLPNSPHLASLLQRMSSNLNKYRFITGGLDLLVRPTSALCSTTFSLPARHRLVLPHLNHYNIAASACAWRQVANWIIEAHGAHGHKGH